MTNARLNGLSVQELRHEAKRTTQTALSGKVSANSILSIAERTLEAGVESEQRGDLHEAFFKYQQGANFLSYALDLPEVKGMAKNRNNDLLQRLSQQQDYLGGTIIPRSAGIESKLKHLDGSQKLHMSGTDAPDSGALDNSPITHSSIADRMRSLQDAGMTVSVPKRFSSDMSRRIPSPPATEIGRLGDNYIPSAFSAQTHAVPTPLNSHHDTGFPRTLDEHYTSALSPKRIEIFTSTPTSFKAIDTTQSTRDAPSDPSPDRSNENSVTNSSVPTTPSPFTHLFPSIDEFDANGDWSHPRSPSSALDHPELPSVPAFAPEEEDRAAHVNLSLIDSPRRPLSLPPLASSIHHTPYSGIPIGCDPKAPPPINSPTSETHLGTVSSASQRSGPLSVVHIPKAELPASSSVFPRIFADWNKKGYKLLLLDVRPRDDFESAHARFEAVVCLEPSILMRDNVSSQQIESALVISPPHEQVLFKNRDKFDAVIMMDQSSTSISSPTLISLFRAIYEVEFSKPLRRPPKLLVGGMDAWARDLGISEVAFQSASSDCARSSEASGIQGSKSPLPRNPHQSPQTLSNEPRDVLNPVLSTNDAPNGTSPRTMLPSSNQNNLPRPVPLGNLPFDPSPIQYPRPVVTPTTSPDVSTLGAFFSQQHGSVMTPLPRASLSSSTSYRRRGDYFESTQSAYSGAASRTSIDYPTISTPSLVSHPPAVASPVLERKDRRPPLMTHGSSISMTSIPPPTIASSYPVTSWGNEEIGLSGLKNLGNTCYMNSTLQCLSATIPFARFFQDGRWKTAVNMLNPLGSKGLLAQAFSSMVSEMWRGEYTYLSPVTFRKSVCLHAPQFNGSNQHDSQEFLSFLLDGLHEDLNRVLTKPGPQTVTLEREAELETLPQQIASAQEWALYRMRNDSLVVDYFQGQFRNRLQCLTCLKTSTTYNAFMYLSLPIPSERGKVDLYQCLDAFVHEEVMEKTEAWNCPNCKTLRKATKQLSLSRLPPVLLIHLKRFSFAGPFTDKLETAVDFPLKGLNLTKYMPPPFPSGDGMQLSLPATDPRRQEPPYSYDLYGVTNHFGSLSSGHYTSFVASKGGWLYCDDSRVSTAEGRDVVGRPAYVLFYKRVL